MSGALGQVEAGVDALICAPVWSASDAEVADETGRVFTVMQRLVDPQRRPVRNTLHRRC